MGRLLAEDSTGALEGRRIVVLCPDPVAALDLAECLERAGADAIAPLDLQQLSSYLDEGLPDAAVSEIGTDRQWPSVAIALLHQLAVPQVLGASEGQRGFLRPKLPNAAFIGTPIKTEEAVLSLSVLLSSNGVVCYAPLGPADCSTAPYLAEPLS